MADTLLKDTDQEELVIVETPVREAPAKDAPIKEEHEDHAEKQEDERQLAAASTEEEREAIRERRRIERAERKERKEKAISRDRLEMDFLRKRNDDLERRFNSIEQRQVSSDLQDIDRRLKDAVNEVQLAEKVIAKAVAAGAGEDVTQAMRYRDQAIAKAQQLNAFKQQATQVQPAQAPSLDDRTLHYAKAFVDENKWYDPQGRDEDSAVVLAIDQTLVRDGFDPKTEKYWEELRKRAARRLPEKFTPPSADADPKADSDRVARGGPSIGSGREHAPASTRKEVYISPERKQALIDAGVWDDPVLRMKYVKRYSEYDKNNRA